VYVRGATAAAAGSILSPVYILSCVGRTRAGAIISGPKSTLSHSSLSKLGCFVLRGNTSRRKRSEIKLAWLDKGTNTLNANKLTNGLAFVDQKGRAEKTLGLRLVFFLTSAYFILLHSQLMLLPGQNWAKKLRASKNLQVEKICLFYFKVKINKNLTQCNPKTTQSL
jgi:hypothetical protein